MAKTRTSFKKGAKGRPKGAINKITQLQREFIQSLLDSQQDKIKHELSGLHGKDYLGAINGLMEFVMPKLQRTELKTSEDDDNNGIKLPMIIHVYESGPPLECLDIKESEN